MHSEVYHSLRSTYVELFQPFDMKKQNITYCQIRYSTLKYSIITTIMRILLLKRARNTQREKRVMLTALTRVLVGINMSSGLTIKAANSWLGYKLSKAMMNAKGTL